ncbi:hypothetical protein [Kitasatospora sp. NPDC058046]|uniref:hypothetical protein n=1 Tax=Kitasatospora sp. NPDC058046 TaxID=3346312 RepID=UPI0036DBBF08
MTGHLLFAAAALLLLVGGLDLDGGEREVGRLWWVRVLPHRTIEVWRRGRFGIRVEIHDRPCPPAP